MDGNNEWAEDASRVDVLLAERIGSCETSMVSLANIAYQRISILAKRVELYEAGMISLENATQLLRQEMDELGLEVKVMQEHLAWLEREQRETNGDHR